MNNRIQEIMDLEHFKTLTPIQEQVLNRKNKNRDIIGVSSTGSGKSHAFFMPIFEMLDFDMDNYHINNSILYFMLFFYFRKE